MTAVFENEEQRKQREHEEDLQRLRGLRPIDDDFMRCLFRDNIPLTQHVLSVLTGKSDLIIISVDTQADMKRLVGARSVCLDAGHDFYELPDTYTIFITENDIFGKGVAFYPIERVNMATNELFGDGEHILYINGAYRGDNV